MKEQSRKESRQKVKRRHRKGSVQKQADNLTQTIGEYTIHLSEVIGQGTYGKVYKATKSQSEEEFACKFIKQERIDDLQIYYKDKKVAEQLQLRLKTQGQFQLKLSKCPFIARMYKTEKNQKGFYFIMEYCEKDLAKVLKKEGFLSEDVALRYFKQTVEGIKYIYQKNAFHRDLKPQNLLLKNDSIKISDFGFVKIFTQIDKQCKTRRNRFQTQSKVGTFRYMSPDILSLLSAESRQTKGNDNTSNASSNQSSQHKDPSNQQNNQVQTNYDPQKSDVWSLGIILYKMLYGKEPYDGKSFDEMIKKIKEQKLDFPGSIQFPPGKIVKVKASKDLIKLIKKMLTPQQNQRIDFMKLYTKLNSLIQQREKEKVRSGIEQSQEPVLKAGDQRTVNKKQRLLSVYNKIMVRIYKDLSTFATLRQIGIENYSQFSYGIMTLLHQKRTSYLQSEDKKTQVKSNRKKGGQEVTQVDQKLKQQVSQYHNVFYEQIRSLSNLKPQDSLQSLLVGVYQQMVNYEDFQLLIKQVQLFLLFLLQLCCLEMGIIKEDYMCATQDKAQSLKFKSIINFKNDAMKLIYHHLNVGQQKQVEPRQSSKQPSEGKDRTQKSSSKNKESTQLKSKASRQRQKSVKKSKNTSS